MLIRLNEFRRNAVGIGKIGAPLAPYDFGRLPGAWSQPSLLCDAPARSRRQDRRDVAAVKLPVLADCQQLCLFHGFASRGELGMPLQPLDPRRNQVTPTSFKRQLYAGVTRVTTAIVPFVTEWMNTMTPLAMLISNRGAGRDCRQES